MHRSVRTRFLRLGAALALAAGGTLAAVAPPASASTSATVAVNANQALATLPATGTGVNFAVYDGTIATPAVQSALSTAGLDAVRYPGGGYADGYHWQTNTVDGGGFVAPNTDFDHYMGTVRGAGAQAIITANYGSGTPQEAAAWVQYANVTKGYGVKYWEIGNEMYGNGEYGAKWENDTHSSHSATTYATNLLQYVSAMKAVDPSIKIGAVLTTPASWPDGIVGPGDTQDWNHTVMSIAGSKIDFVIVHTYPGSTSEADLLGKPQALVPSMMSTLHSLINQYAGANAPNVGIAVTESNATSYRDTAPNGLFAPDQYLTLMENGAFNVDWWDIHNGTDCTNLTTVDGATDFNDYGMLSSGASASCEPAQNTPFPAYYGTEMISKLGSPGDTLVSASSSTSLVSAHAVKRANGDVDVMLINKDPNNDASVSLSYNGFTPGSGTPTVYSYLKNSTSITSAATGGAGSQTVPAYSVVVVQLHPGSGGSPASTGELHAVGAGKCLDVNGAVTTPGTQMQIWDCSGSANQIWTHTASNQLTVYSGSSQMCLDAYGNGTTNGTKVDIWSCNGQRNQQWTLNADGSITGVQSGLCLDVSNLGTADGSLVQLWGCNGQSNQRWTLG
ncbi:ricin-type beta-trefoil lectin domain protein [Catenulispora rubra]|uniref:ricin-type beta-trefoil lectin domain protein n=1 Tax=Catenulispora rubra TaxID=280293 RepID=UPI001E28DA23|nr:ricin-type beta-trefoil lectin domain protein [Catenulispora rubra]